MNHDNITNNNVNKPSRLLPGSCSIAHWRLVFPPLFFLLLLTCLQGPWEYRPADTEVFRGITLNAYVVSGWPVRGVCLEKLNALDESYTPAFPFYDSARVTITGDGGSGRRTIELTPRAQSPMCFDGPDDFIAQNGETYRLEAVVEWDSAGEATVTTIRGQATVPQTWSIDSTAKVNAVALSGTTISDSVPAGGVEAFFGSLPERISEQLQQIYQPEIAPIANDSAALADYFAENAQRISASLDSLLQSEENMVAYTDGDTVQYLGGTLNLTSHIFRATYSNDIRGLLITHHFTDSGVNAFTRFDNIAANFGESPPGAFYFRGTTRRIQFFDLIEEEGDDGFRLFEAIPVSNAYLKGGRNVIYFFGTDDHYADFVETYINQHSSANVTPVHSVTGGHGFFAGLAVDSFAVHIEIPKDIISFNVFESHADFCNDEGWNNTDCRQFEPDYCRQVRFNDMQYAFDNPDIIKEPELRNNCLAEAVAYYLEQGKSVRYYQDSILTNGNTLRWKERAPDGTVKNASTQFTDAQLKRAREEGKLRYCMRNDFGDEICTELENAAQKLTAESDTLDKIFTWCEENGWDGDACRGWVREKFCKEKSGAAEAICNDIE